MENKDLLEDVLQKTSQLVEETKEIKPKFNEIEKKYDEKILNLEKKLEDSEKNNSALEQKLEDEKKELDRVKINMNYFSKNSNSKDEEEKLNKFNIELKSFNKSNDNIDLDKYDSYGKSFEKFLRTGNENLLEAQEFKALREGYDGDGGYLVRPEYSTEIINKVFETSNLRNLASVKTISSDMYKYIVNFDEFEAEYIKEIQDVNYSSTPEFKEKSITVNTLYVKVLMSHNLLEDSYINMENEVSKGISESFIKKDNLNFLYGDGIEKPRGLFTYPEGDVYGKVKTIETEDSTNIKYQDIINMASELPDKYQDNASIIMSRQLFMRYFINQVSATDGQPFGVNYFPTNQVPGMASRGVATIAGYPVYFMQDMPKNADVGNQYVVAIGDFRKAYTIVDRIGISIMKDIYTKDNAVVFKGRKRGGGDVVNTQAFIVGKVKA